MAGILAHLAAYGAHQRGRRHFGLPAVPEDFTAPGPDAPTGACRPGCTPLCSRTAVLAVIPTALPARLPLRRVTSPTTSTSTSPAASAPPSTGSAGPLCRPPNPRRTGDDPR